MHRRECCDSYKPYFHLTTCPLMRECDRCHRPGPDLQPLVLEGVTLGWFGKTCLGRARSEVVSKFAERRRMAYRRD